MLNRRLSPSPAGVVTVSRQFSPVWLHCSGRVSDSVAVMRSLLAVFLLAGGLYQQAHPSLAAEFARLARDIETSVPESDRGPLFTRLERGRAALAGTPHRR